MMKVVQHVEVIKTEYRMTDIHLALKIHFYFDITGNLYV